MGGYLRLSIWALYNRKFSYKREVGESKLEEGYVPLEVEKEQAARSQGMQATS